MMLVLTKKESTFEIQPAGQIYNQIILTRTSHEIYYH